VIPDGSDLDGGDVPWALQVVVRVERDPAPAHTAVLSATASAVALALAEFTGDDAGAGVRERTERWRSGPIRKVVRRARGAGWTRQLSVPDVFVHEVHGVPVAVHVPGPVDQVHPEIARLQVGGLTLEDTEMPDSSAAPVRLVLNPRVEMTTGKAAAQVGHGAQLVLESLTPDASAAWLDAGAPVEVVTSLATDWDRLVETAPVVVADGGFTEVAPGTITVVALHPWSSGGRVQR
jgi:peptidyl-tRNA hydrolase